MITDIKGESIMTIPRFDSKFEEMFLKTVPRNNGDREVIRFIEVNDPFQRVQEKQRTNER
jgi:hypothetical protein